MIVYRLDFHHFRAITLQRKLAFGYRSMWGAKANTCALFLLPAELCVYAVANGRSDFSLGMLFVQVCRTFEARYE